ncbi:hypothetical protein VTL71DRAFT_2907 [Oculimacula yallundae]|uniref:Peptidase S8/S53 domain-containing protein n=1 Tax=Oculimacula yallundae TaxID=86028 RepID=A0ABR4C5L6_9HELO
MIHDLQPPSPTNRLSNLCHASCRIEIVGTLFQISQLKLNVEATFLQSYCGSCIVDILLLGEIHGPMLFAVLFLIQRTIQHSDSTKQLSSDCSSDFSIYLAQLAIKGTFASSGLIIPGASPSSTNPVLSTNYCLRRRALQPGVPCISQSETSTYPEPSTSSTLPSLSAIPGDTTSVSSSSQSQLSDQASSTSASSAATTSSFRSSATPTPVIGLPEVTKGQPNPSSSVPMTKGAATTSTQFQHTATITTGSVTVETVTFSFNLLTKPPPRPEKDGKSSAEQVHVDFVALVPKMKSAASVFDTLGSTFSAFSSAVSSPGATDDSVRKAGGGLLGFFHSAFSVAADIGTNLASMGLSELDQSTKLLDRFEQASVDIFDFGKVITNIEPLLVSGGLGLASGNTILGSSSAILKGIGIGEGLRELAKLAEQSRPDTSPTPTPDSTPQSTPEPTIQSTPTTRPSTSSTATSTSSSASATETKIYSISTKQGTKVEDFYALINSLPDQGRGMKIVYPNLDWQVYGSYLTEAQAEEVRHNPIIRTVVEDGFVDDEGEEDYSVLPKKLQARVDVDPYPMLNLASQPISPVHLNLLSQGPINAAARRAQPALPISDYLMSSKGGEGITIFVIDTGINPSHPEFVNSYTMGDHYVVPNGLLGLPATQPAVDPQTGESVMVPFVPDPDNVMSESRNHGSCVASLAAGRVYGVAKKAHLYPIKYKNSRGAVTELALQAAFMHVINTVMNKDSRKDGPPTTPGWAVLSFSQGFGLLEGKAWQTRRNLMEVLLKECWKNDIVTVIAAGNEGDKPGFDLSRDIPACLGTPTNPLITVGATNSQGNRLPLTNKDTGLGGSITTSAQGDNEVRCVAPGASGSQTQKGTSVAAPQIAGLAAYFLSLPQEELPEAINADTAAAHMPGIPVFLGPSLTGGKFIGPDLHIKGQVSQAVKDYLVRMSYKRNPAHPDAVAVAYNGVEEGLCKAVLPNASFKRKRGGIVPRAGEGDLVPVVVSGVMASTASYPLPACALPTSSSSTRSSSSSSASSVSSISSVSLTPSLSSIPSTLETTSTIASTTPPIVAPPTTTSEPAPTIASSPPAALQATVTSAEAVPTPPPPPHTTTVLPSPTPKKWTEKPCKIKCNDNGDIIG